MPAAFPRRRPSSTSPENTTWRSPTSVWRWARPWMWAKRMTPSRTITCSGISTRRPAFSAPTTSSTGSGTRGGRGEVARPTTDQVERRRRDVEHSLSLQEAARRTAPCHSPEAQIARSQGGDQSSGPTDHAGNEGNCQEIQAGRPQGEGRGESEGSGQEEAWVAGR